MASGLRLSALDSVHDDLHQCVCGLKDSGSLGELGADDLIVEQGPAKLTDQ